MLKKIPIYLFIIISIFIFSAQKSFSNENIPSYAFVKANFNKWKATLYNDALTFFLVAQRTEKSKLYNGSIPLLKAWLNPNSKIGPNENVDKEVTKRAKNYSVKQNLTVIDMNNIFKDSLEKDSRASKLIEAYCINYVSPSCIAEFIILLSSEVRGSAGGFEDDMTKGTAVYLSFKENLKNFTSYYLNKPLPPSGKLVRDQIPFLVFTSVDNKILLTTVSKEIIPIEEALALDISFSFRD